MTEFEKGYEQGYKDGIAGAALPNVNDNGDKIDGYGYAYKTDSNGEPYIHIDCVRSMLKKAADVQPVVDVPRIEVKPMAEDELQILIKGIFRRIKEKYGYTDEQVRIYLQGCQDCAEENQEALEKRDKMLRDTVTELVEAKRLLKLAVEDFSNMYDHIFDCDGMCDTCPLHGERDHCLKWCYADEAEKLLRED